VSKAKVLIVDDEEVIRDSFSMALNRAGYSTVTAESGAEALMVLGQERGIACVVSDIRMPGMSGLELLGRIREEHPGLPVIIISAHGTPEDAAQAIKLGALDYFSKPFSAVEIEARISKAVEHHKLEEEAATLREVVRRQSEAGGDLICEADSPMGQLRDLLVRVANSEATVLIHGESGVGKEVVARFIHAHSSRAARPFLAVNCAALSAGLLESELFGHEKGAFTGADRLRKGRFELARGGTLLLDEVSEIDVNLQAKLLRVLQERNFERVGSSEMIRADVRVLATTNRNLEQAVKDGKFREDLYYRLNVLPVKIPALRERPTDLRCLAEHFLRRHAAVLGRKAPTLTDSGLAVLGEHRWPGNVRELQNLLERVLVLESASELSAEILAGHVGLTGPLPVVPRASVAAPAAASAASKGTASAPGAGGAAASLFPMPSGDDQVPSIDEMEEKLIRFAMQRLNGDRKQVADRLGITGKTLLAKLRKLGMAS